MAIAAAMVIIRLVVRAGGVSAAHDVLNAIANANANNHVPSAASGGGSHRVQVQAHIERIEIGGHAEMNVVQWAQQRYVIEEGRTSSSSVGPDGDISPAVLDASEPSRKRSQLGFLQKISPSSHGRKNAITSGTGDLNSDPSNLMNDSSPSSALAPSQHAVLATPSAVPLEITAEEQELLNISTSGRKSDARMDRAVILCMRNPKIDRFDALIGGGFVYPRPESVFIAEMRLKDADGVTLRQRKNQLRRRLGNIELTKKGKREKGKTAENTSEDSC